jgi:hypothetical protein
MASIASEGRAAFMNAFFVTFVLTIALAPWQPAGPERVVVSLDEVRRPPVIVPMEPYREPAPVRTLTTDMLLQLFGGARASSESVIVPPVHPDAKAWPHGMVITPPPFADDMSTGIPSALDNMLSGLLAPWLAIAS